MPRQYHMSWEGPPNFRWVKMYKGVRYRVSCADLRAMIFTKEATGKLANAWWERKLQQIEGDPSRVDKVREILAGEDDLSRKAQRAVATRDERDRALQAVLERVADHPKDIGGMAEAIGLTEEKLLKMLAALQVETRPEVRDLIALDAAVDAISTSGAPTERVFKQHAERFLAVVRDQIKPLSFREIRSFIQGLYVSPLLGGDTVVDAVTEEKVEQVFLWLKTADLTPATRKKRWGFFRRFVKYLWSCRLIEMPRNLDTLNFKVAAKAVKTFPLDEVRACLKALKPRLRLYALLGLNCGMTSADIGRLRKEQVDLTNGRLVRKRVKTSDHGTVPTVDYPLWPETLNLLAEHWSADPSLALTSEDGTALWDSRQEGAATPTKDLIYQQFKRAKASVTIKNFRSIAATVLESHEGHGRYVTHFLGHSPKSIKDKHYAAPSRERFDEAMGWLRAKVLGGE